MGSFRKMERGFYRRMIGLALPLILQNLITNSLALADTFMVGLMGEGPLAGVTLANIPIFVEQLMIFGFQSGSSVLISQYYGKRDEGAINEVLGIGVYVAGGLTLLFGSVMFFFPASFMGLFGSDAAVVDIAARYVRIVAYSIFFGGLSEVYIAAHRSMGNPRLGLYILTASMTVNVVLNYALIFGRLGCPRMGVEGAALATLIARVLQFVLAVGHGFLGKRFRIRFRRLLKPGGEMVRRFIRFATPVVMNETLWGLGTAIYPTIMGHMEGSKEILAAYALAGNVERICTVAIFAVAGTAAILVGQAVGSGQHERARAVGNVMNDLSALLGLVTGGLAVLAVYTLAPRYLYPLMGLSQEAADITTMMLTVTFAALFLQAFNTTSIVGVLRGGGDVRAAALLDLLPLWVFAVPLSALVGLVFKWGILWVTLVRALEQTVKAVPGYLRCRSGKWVRDVTAVKGETELGADGPH